MSEPYWVPLGGAPAPLPVFRGARVRNTAVVAVPTNMVHPIPWQVEDFDTDGFFDPANPTIFTLVLSGKYLIVGGFRWADDVGGSVRGCTMTLSGVGGITAVFQPPGGGGRAAHSVNVLRHITAGQTVNLSAFHDKGSDLNVNVVNEFFFALQYLGA
jgi:hypothetical protein